jgi:uncharacterized membrane protein YheB (UPF0754 family)
LTSLPFNLAETWIYFSAPVVGGIIGYFTNDVAIRMLFRPYKAYYIGRRKIPFTPGLIPANQERLAKRIADAIMGSLLTPSELQNVARRLLETERIQAAISWLLRLAIEQVKVDADKKTVKILANILRDLVGESFPRLLRTWAKREDFLESQLNQIFDKVILELQFTENQANYLSDWLLQVVLPPDVLRQGLIDFLSDKNIQIIDEVFKEKTSGTYWVVANLFGLKNALTRLRTFCLDEKDVADRRLAELIISLEIQKRIKEWLQSLSMQNLPVHTVRQFRKTVRDSVRIYLQEKGADLLSSISASIEWENLADLIITRLRNSAILDVSLELVSQELALVLERYLEKDLEKIVMQVIPILDLDTVIINRVKATSPADLEDAINSIVKSELQGIVNLGGILGVLVGTLQAFLLYLQK